MEPPQRLVFSKRGAQYFSAQRLIDLALVVLLGWLVGTGAIVYSGAMGASGGSRICNDFAVIYSAGRLTLQGRIHEAYDVTSMAQALSAFCRLNETIRNPWVYPPPVNFFAETLARLPYGFAWFVFIAGSLCSYLYVLRRLSHSLAHFDIARIACLPAMIVTILGGQNGFVTATLIGLFSLFFIEGRRLAGAPLGFLFLKPQLTIGVTLLAVLMRRFGLLGTAAIITLLLCASATLFFGVDSWRFFADAIQAAAIFLREGAYPLFRMTSAYALAFSLSATPSVAFVLQIGSALVCLFGIIQMWRRAIPLHQLLGVAILLSYGFSPYVYDYDWVSFGVAAALLVPLLEKVASRIEISIWIGLAWMAQGSGALIALFARNLPGHETLMVNQKYISFGGAFFLLLALWTLNLMRRQRKLMKTILY